MNKKDYEMIADEINRAYVKAQQNFIFNGGDTKISDAALEQLKTLTALAQRLAFRFLSDHEFNEEKFFKMCFGLLP